MEKAFKDFSPGKQTFKDKIKGNKPQNSLVDFIRTKENSCFICQEVEKIYKCYLDTFFYLYKNDSEFLNKVKNSKGFCLTHFGDLCEMADDKLSENDLKDFYSIMNSLMIDNMKRMQGDVSWLVDKFDYTNKDADWKNSKDANQRAMQKLKGGYFKQ